MPNTIKPSTYDFAALADFKLAVDTCLPQLTADDLNAARQYFNDVLNKREKQTARVRPGSS